MSENPTLTVEKRTDFGKGFARRARTNNKIPAVIYGHGIDPIHVTLPYHDTFLLVKDNENAVISLQGLDESSMVLVKDIQRHPLKRNIMHMDLLLVKADEKVEVEVPVELIGEPAPGMAANQDLLNLLVLAPVVDIPERIEVNIEGMEDGTIVKVSDVQMPEGVEAKTDLETVVLSIAEPQEVVIPEPTEAEEAEEEATEGESGATEGEGSEEESE